MQKNPMKKLVYKYKVNIGVEIGNYQWKLWLLNIFKIQLIQVSMKQNQNLIHIEEMKMNKMHVIHIIICFIYKEYI